MKKFKNNPNNNLVQKIRSKSPEGVTSKFKASNSTSKLNNVKEENYINMLSEKDKTIEFLKNRIKALENEIAYMKEKCNK